MNDFSIGITHADSLAGEAVLQALAEIEVDSESIKLYAAPETAGCRLSLGEHYLVTQDQASASFEECTLVMQLQKDDELSDKIVNKGIVLIKQGGNLCLYPEQDCDAGFDFSQTVFDLVDSEAYLVLKVLNQVRDVADIVNAQVTMLRSASYEGKAGIDELAKQTVDLLNVRPVAPVIFPVQQAFNVITENCDSKDSLGLADVIKYNLGEEIESVQLHSVHAPYFHGVTLLVSVQCNSIVNEALLKRSIAELPGVTLHASNDEIVSPVTSLTEDSLLSISQLMVNAQNEQNLQFMITADQFRHGTAEIFLNALAVIRKTFL